MKKKLFLLSALMLSIEENVLATPIEWEIVSPIIMGASIEGDGKIVNLGENFSINSQAKGIYGAGFYTSEGGSLNIRIDLATSDSWNQLGGYFDRFILTSSASDFFWLSKYSQETLFQFGGLSRKDYTHENYSGYLQFQLEPGTFFSFALETKMDNYFPSFGSGDFIFTENEKTLSNIAPVPEPATTLLFGTGLIALAGISRKRRNDLTQ